jgi:hypothetical protein
MSTCDGRAYPRDGVRWFCRSFAPWLLLAK